MLELSNFTNEQIVLAGLIGFVAVSLVGILIWFFTSQKKTVRAKPQVTSAAQPPKIEPSAIYHSPKFVEIARIEERVEFSTGGVFAVLLLVIFNFISLLTFAVSTTILQETLAGVIWIGSNILWGIAAIIGRKRSYIVRREVRDAQNGSTA